MPEMMINCQMIVMVNILKCILCLEVIPEHYRFFLYYDELEVCNTCIGMLERMGMLVFFCGSISHHFCIVLFVVFN